MGSPGLTRRSFLFGSAGLALGSALTGSLLRAAAPTRTRWVLSGLYDYQKKTFAIGILDFSAGRRVDLPVMHSGHGLCLHPTKANHAILFAQRPGTVSYEFDFVNGKVTNEFRTGYGRHFYGHGLDLAAHDAILCTENNILDGSGVVTVRDPDSYEVKGEFSTHGIGPHDMRLLNGGATIAIANGGHRTMPDGLGGVVTLTKDPKASLALVDTMTGELQEQIEFPGSRLKHLHVSKHGTLGLALRGPGDSLCVLRHPDGKLVRARDTGGIFEKMHHHTLSIRVCDRTNTVGVTAPKGHLVAFWDTRSGDLKKIVPLPGATGLEVAHDERHFVLTSRGEGAQLEGLTSKTARAEPSNGRVLLVDSKTLEPVAHEIAEPDGTIWASHSLAITEG